MDCPRIDTGNKEQEFYFVLTVHLDISLCNENQPDALFILCLFRQ